MAVFSIDIYLIILFIGLFPYVAFLIRHYAQKDFPWHTYITLFITYYSSFGILLLVPIDIASVVIDRRSTIANSDPNYTSDVELLSPAYDTFFTILVIFGSFLLDFEEHYNNDGTDSFGHLCLK
jgi:hypothetical protein